MIEDDDDTHICLKCHVTITGLDNYVSHRKSGCNTQSSHSKPRTLSPLIPPDEPDFSLKADDFFSLLELQSSSKKQSIPVPSGGKTNSGVLTRSKATAVIQANTNRASDWIGGHQLRELGNEDNQTKLIKAVDNISGNIKKDEPTRIRYEEEIEDDSNDDYDDEEEEYEEECHNAPPRTHTGGKWKPSTSPIQWLRPSSSHSHEDRSEWDPPPSHTGGKWKPMLPQRRNSDGEEDEDKNAPPPDHTKGKWIPGRNTLESSSHSNQRVEEIPPLRKSSGMVQYWCGPCNRRLASKIVYDRHLRSELHYKRTLHEREFENSSDYLNQKNVHRKRAEGKRKIKKPQHLWVVKNEKPKKERLKKQSYIRCEVCRSKVLNYLMGKHLISHYHCRKRNTLKPVSQQMVLDHIFGIVLQSPFQCSACRFFCNEESDFLQHWRSDTHLSASNTSSGIFLCSFCKYETKHNDLMEEHLLSDSHREVVSVINRSVPIIIKRIVPVSCSTCQKSFRFNAELRKHCLKENHVLSFYSTDKYQDRHCCPDCNFVLKSYKALQRHLLKMHGKNLYFCSTCALTFDTEQESKLHRKTPEHRCVVTTRNFETGNDVKDLSRKCQYCYLKFPNILCLKQHLQKNHPDHSCSCPHCGLKFTLSQEVTQHIKSKSCSFPSSSTNSPSNYFNCEKCPYKTTSEGDFIFHLALHTEPIQMLYPDAEEESGGGSGNIGHNSGGNVTGNSGVNTDVRREKIVRYRCPVCEKVFRKGSLRCHVRQHVNERPYKCEKCNAAYARKSNLMSHIKARHGEEFNKKRTEIDEMEEIVDDPSDDFEERRQLHEQRHEINKGGMNVKMQENEKSREKTFLCADCGKSFLKKFTLLQHACTHTGKEYVCGQPGCVYRARNAAELRIHRTTHVDVRPFACTQCEFRTKTKAQLTRHARIHDGDEGKKHTCPFCAFSARTRSHLKRHLRLHTGAKPYKCPHCEYSCNNLENLRKHILNTNRHPGKSIYTCTWCTAEGSFATNFAKEFHVHLVTAHSDRFDAASAKEAASRLVGIYNKEEDEKVVEDKGSDSSKRFKISQSPSPSLISIPSLPSTSTTLLPIPTTTLAATQPLRPTTLIPIPTTSSATHTLVDPELLSMVVVKEDVVFVSGETWAMEGFYGVEATTLVNYEDGQGLLGSEGFDEDD